jgi:hypothetical protein
MTSAIWKYLLPITQQPIIKMPAGARVLSAKMQNMQPCVWAYVPDINAELEDRFFAIYATGEIEDGIDGDLRFVDTLLMSYDSLVAHVFIKE